MFSDKHILWWFTRNVMTKFSLTILSRLKFPTLINWISPFFCFKGCWVEILIFIKILKETSVSKQWKT